MHGFACGFLVSAVKAWLHPELCCLQWNLSLKLNSLLQTEHFLKQNTYDIFGSKTLITFHKQNTYKIFTSKPLITFYKLNTHHIFKGKPFIILSKAKQLSHNTFSKAKHLSHCHRQNAYYIFKANHLSHFHKQNTYHIFKSKSIIKM